MCMWKLKLKKYNATYNWSKNKYLGVNLTKYVKDLNVEMHQMLVKEIKVDLNNERDIP